MRPGPSTGYQQFNRDQRLRTMGPETEIVYNVLCACDKAECLGLALIGGWVTPTGGGGKHGRVGGGRSKQSQNIHLEMETRAAREEKNVFDR